MSVWLLRPSEWPMTARSVFIGNQVDVVHLKAFLDIVPLVSNLNLGKMIAEESLKKLFAMS